jgi:hypothetical protein
MIMPSFGRPSAKFFGGKRTLMSAEKLKMDARQYEELNCCAPI